MTTGNPDLDRFYKSHSGGSGKIICVFAYHDDEDERLGVFGSIETAHAWAAKFDDDWSCVFVPYIVDYPDFGNVTQN